MTMVGKIKTIDEKVFMKSIFKMMSKRLPKPKCTKTIKGNIEIELSSLAQSEIESTSMTQISEHDLTLSSAATTVSDSSEEPSQENIEILTSHISRSKRKLKHKPLEIINVERETKVNGSDVSSNKEEISTPEEVGANEQNNQQPQNQETNLSLDDFLFHIPSYN